MAPRFRLHLKPHHLGWSSVGSCWVRCSVSHLPSRFGADAVVSLPIQPSLSVSPLIIHHHWWSSVKTAFRILFTINLRYEIRQDLVPTLDRNLLNDTGVIDQIWNLAKSSSLGIWRGDSWMESIETSQTSFDGSAVFGWIISGVSKPNSIKPNAEVPQISIRVVSAIFGPNVHAFLRLKFQLIPGWHCYISFLFFFCYFVALTGRSMALEIHVIIFFFVIDTIKLNWYNGPIIDQTTLACWIKNATASIVDNELLTKKMRCVLNV